MRTSFTPTRAAVAAVGLAIASSAHAQSSVTLYGVADIGINYSSNTQTSVGANGVPVGHSQTFIADGLNAGKMGSRWGILGKEDLSAGLQAVFNLENGFSMANGTFAQGGAEFGRQAWVGLKSDTLGMLSAGRQYEFTTEYVGVLSAVTTFGGEFSTHPGNADGLLNIRRVNNALKYQSPDFHGISFGTLVGLGGVPGSISQNSVFGGGLRYNAGGFAAAVSYLNARNPNISAYGINPNAGGVTSNNLGSAGSATSAQSAPIIAGFASANTLEEIAVGGTYKFANEQVGAVFTRTAFKGLGNTSQSGPNPLHLQGSANVSNAEVSFKHNFTPTLSAAAAYDYAWVSSVGNLGTSHYHQVSAGSDYALSKRTDLYVLAAWEQANGTNSLGKPAVAQIGFMSPSATNHQVALTAGIAHRF
ncbi:porin [Paraburkholderia antibiotica]|uniref:Porin n=1 Tax=Paraburkholderia antibiotica TaxID=2728839 RepID=A0A7X9X9I9_9BURK|nr:porin [Paraburkholderia antibiotica]NML33858.1 porin [Paraburkholderia antibiotica]